MKNKYFLARKTYLISSILTLFLFLFTAIPFLMVDVIYIFVFIYAYLICFPVLVSHLSFIKLTDEQLIYFGLFKKKKIINLNEVKKIEFGYFRKDVDIRFIGKEKQVLIRCTLNIKLLGELIKIYDKKMFRLSIAHRICSKKTITILTEIFSEKLLEEKNIHTWFHKK